VRGSLLYPIYIRGIYFPSVNLDYSNKKSMRLVLLVFMVRQLHHGVSQADTDGKNNLVMAHKSPNCRRHHFYIWKLIGTRSPLHLPLHMNPILNICSLTRGLGLHWHMFKISCPMQRWSCINAALCDNC
jgi:hypothetical protein